MAKMKVLILDQKEGYLKSPSYVLKNVELRLLRKAKRTAWQDIKQLIILFPQNKQQPNI